jgi:hypothetical protein
VTLDITVQAAGAVTVTVQDRRMGLHKPPSPQPVPDTQNDRFQAAVYRRALARAIKQPKSVTILSAECLSLRIVLIYTEMGY